MIRWIVAAVAKAMACQESVEAADQWSVPWLRRRVVRYQVRADRSEHRVTGIRVVPLRVECFRREGHGHGDGDFLRGEVRFRRAVAVEERVLQQP